MNISKYITKIDRDDISIHIPNNLSCNDSECLKGVLLISHELSRTGAPIQMLVLAKALLALGYQPFVYSLSEGELINDYMDINVPVICGMGPAQNAEWIDKLVYDFDIIFINTLLLVAYVRYFASSPKRVFWWIHESAHLFKEKYCTDIPNSSRLTILAASEKTQSHISKYMQRDSDLLNVCVQDSYVLKNGTSYKTTFLWSGFLDFNKAPEILFKAVLNLPKEYLNKTEYIVVGQSRNNNEYAELVKMISSKLPNIHFMNAIGHEDFLKLINSVDSVIVTSLEETTSLVAVEGFMMGKIVICSEGCGITKYIDDTKNGFVFPTRDSKKLSEIIQFVADKKNDLDILRHSGRILYEKNYSFNIFISSIKILLDHII